MTGAGHPSGLAISWLRHMRITLDPGMLPDNTALFIFISRVVSPRRRVRPRPDRSFYLIPQQVAPTSMQIALSTPNCTEHHYFLPVFTLRWLGRPCPAPTYFQRPCAVLRTVALACCISSQ